MFLANHIEDSLSLISQERSVNRHQNSQQEDTVVLVWVAKHA